MPGRQPSPHWPATRCALWRSCRRPRAALLTGLNDTVLARGEPERFLSAIYLTTRKTADGVEVKLARGGHPSPLLRRVDGTVDMVDAPGRLLGCLPNPGLADVPLLLAPGELLLLHTDGVTEARRANEQFSDTRLRTLLAASIADAHTIVDHVIDAALAHCDGELTDDAAVMAILAT